MGYVSREQKNCKSETYFFPKNYQLPKFCEKFQGLAKPLAALRFYTWGRMLGIWQARKGREVLHCRSFATKRMPSSFGIFCTLRCTINLLRKVYNLTSFQVLPKAERCLPTYRSPRWIPRVGWWKLFLIVPSLGSERKRVQTEKTFVEYQLASCLLDPVSISTSSCAKNSNTSFPSSFLNLFYYAYIP